MNTKENVKNIYPLTPVQEGMLYHYLMDKSSYFEQICYRIDGDVQVDFVQKSFEELVQRHDVLRTAFLYENVQRPLQVVLRQRKPEFQFIDCSGHERIGEYLQSFKEADRSQGFNLVSESLIRIAILKTGTDEHEFVWSFHHLLMDGWCISILISEFNTLYNACIKSIPASLPTPEPYSRYIEWIARLDHSASQEYWTQYLTEYEKPSVLKDRSLSGIKVENYDKQEFTFTIDEKRTEQLVTLARQGKATVSSLVQVLWGLVLSKHCNSHDAVFGYVVSGRPTFLKGIETMVGLFINMIPVRIRYTPKATFNELLANTQKSNLDAEAHHYFPLVEIQRLSELKQNLFDHCIAFENYPIADSVKKSGETSEVDFTISDVSVHEKSNYDLNISIGLGREMLWILHYNGTVYKKTFFQQLADRISYCVDQLLSSNGEIRLGDIELATPADRHLVLRTFNNTHAPYPCNDTIQSIFDKVASKHHADTALVFGSRKFSYGEILASANALAAHLCRIHKIKSNDLITVLLDNSENVIIAKLAVLKTGAAYLPVDPNTPQDRIRKILMESGSSIILTESSRFSVISQFYNGALLAVDLYTSSASDGSGKPQLPSGQSGDLAYVMYTSGTSGKPKGVAIEHRSVLRLVLNNSFFQFQPGFKILLTGAISFDASTFEIWGPLLNGGELHILPREKLIDPGLLREYLLREKINVLWLTSAWFNQLVDLDVDMFRSLKYLLVGGDVLSPVHISRVRFAFPDVVIINGYGPTENTTFSTTHVIGGESGAIPIGKPISNSTAYILGENFKVQPVGVPGEIHLGGDGLAREYYRNPDLTAEKFVNITLDDTYRLYRTGDIGYWREDGTIAFIGRKDSQHKIRGYRIELQEIESIMRECTSARNIFLTVMPDRAGDKKIIAFVTQREGSESEMLDLLMPHLPVYMLPSRIVSVNTFPLNANGKIDVEQLPDPFTSNATARKKYPSNETEQRLLKIWSDVLGIADISTADNFFVIGGDSIKAIRLVGQINKGFGLSAEIKEIFNHQSIVSQGKWLLSMQPSDVDAKAESLKDVFRSFEMLKSAIIGNADYLHLLPHNWDDIYPMSDVQLGMVYHNLFDVGSSIYHDQLFYRISDTSFDFTLFKRAFSLLVQKHAILRTCFYLKEFDVPVQVIASALNDDTTITFVDIAQFSSAEQYAYIEEILAEDRAVGFDLKKPGLWRLKVFAMGNNEFGIAWIFHHAIIDGWSNASLLAELSKIYDQSKSQPVVEIPALVSSYRDYVVEEQISKLNKDLKDYWKQYLRDYQRTPLPFHVVPPQSQADNPVIHARVLDRDLHRELLTYSTSHNVGIKDICFSAFLSMISVISGTRDITVGLITHGRPSIEDGDKILGCFLNTIPFRIFADLNLPPYDFICHVKKQADILKSYDKLSLREILKLTEESSSAKNALVDIVFNYVDFYILNESISDTELKETENLNFQSTNTLFDFSVCKYDSGIIFTINTFSNLYDRGTLDRLFSYYQDILKAIVTNRPILEAVPAREERKVLMDHADGLNLVPIREGFLDEGVGSNALSHPDNVALIFNEESVSYFQLNAMADNLANDLVQKFHLPQGELVALIADRSIDTIVAILGILKAGGCFVPIDASYPPARIEYLLKEIECKIVLTTNQQAASAVQLPDSCSIVQVQAKKLQQRNTGTATLVGNRRQSDLAYIIFTSGSTGKPKGVKVEHRTAMNMVRDQIKRFAVTPSDNFLQFASISFDASIYEIFIALNAGARLTLIAKQKIDNPFSFVEYIEAQGVTLVTLPPSYLATLDIQRIHFLRTIITAGEAAIARDAELCAEFAEYYNAYGPTEASVCSTIYKVDRFAPSGRSIPIGKPISNTKVYLMNEHGSLVPIGVKGELYIGGAGVCQGYLNNPTLTSERFVKSPFNKEERLYRTGDMGKYLPDGKIEFLGRVDEQVKINGHRIELKEIHNAILQHPGVSDAYVLKVTTDEHHSFIAAFYTGAVGVEVTDVTQSLSVQLPAFMMPKEIIKLLAMPVTSNGKVDALKLRDYITTQVKPHIIVAPANETEEKVMGFYKEILRNNEVGTESDFFAHGGDSIAAIRLAGKVSQHYKIAIRDIFNYPTVKSLSKVITEQKDYFKTKIEEFVQRKDDSLNKKETADLIQAEREYQHRIRKYKKLTLAETVHYKNILLVGATGFLGCYILRELLRLDIPKITLLIRSEKRLSHAYAHYFDERIEQYSNRVNIVEGDLAIDHFGLNSNSYHALANVIDGIINTAALVKHYGKPDDFENVNVKGVERLIEFAALQPKKDIHHVSTASVASGIVSGKRILPFSEFDLDAGQVTNNIYVDTKIQAEKLLHTARTNGLNTNIYRVGNLVCDSKTGVFQPAMHDNDFYSRIRSFIHAGVIPDLEGSFQLTNVDVVAHCITKLFNRKELRQETFHLYNPNRIPAQLFTEFVNRFGYELRVIDTMELFRQSFENEEHSQLKTLMLEYLPLIEGDQRITHFHMLSDKTNAILMNLGLGWHEPDYEDIKLMLNYCLATGFLSESFQTKYLVNENHIEQFLPDKLQ